MHSVFELTKDRKQRHFVVGERLDRQTCLYPSAQAALYDCDLNSVLFGFLAKGVPYGMEIFASQPIKGNTRINRKSVGKYDRS